MKKKNRPLNGLTLIELLVVVSIVGTLSSITLVALNSARSKGRDGLRVSQIHEVKKGLALYFSAHGKYPANPYPLTFGEEIPHNWSAMMNDLTVDGLIEATFPVVDLKTLPVFSLFRIANALSAIYYDCSIQDPLYRIGTDYGYSYGYVVSPDRQSYKIRFYMENIGKVPVGGLSQGTFLDGNTTGITACDINSHYFCVSSDM